MATTTIDNKSFSTFIKQNKKKIYDLAEKNVVRNSKGEVVITKDDPWFYEDEWDEMYKEIKKDENR